MPPKAGMEHFLPVRGLTFGEMFSPVIGVLGSKSKLCSMKLLIFKGKSW